MCQINHIRMMNSHWTRFQISVLLWSHSLAVLMLLFRIVLDQSNRNQWLLMKTIRFLDWTQLIDEQEEKIPTYPISWE